MATKIYEFFGGEEVATIDLRAGLQAERDKALISELRHKFELALVKNHEIFSEILDREETVDGVRTVIGFSAVSALRIRRQYDENGNLACK